ncbi:MAG: ChaN family lipoprotein [Deltaproteobacteria bacterium]|nr:ChaN family lipoprotein [Deltaproteobacteria bacterium]
MHFRRPGARLFVVAAVSVLSILVPGVDIMGGCQPFIIDLLMGEPIPMEMMLDDISLVRLVYVGEIHTVDRHHRVQAELLRRLTERNAKLAVGMEMFSQGQQQVLDRWQTGKDDLSALVQELGKEHWTNLMDYESVLLSARDAAAPIVCLNADDDLVRKIARTGLDGLNESERQQVPEGVNQIDQAHDRLLRLKLRVHKAFQNKSLDNVVLAQALRDETMAQAVIRFIESPQGKDRIMLVIAGAGHLNYGFGIPDRVQSRLDVPYRIILPSESGELVLSEEDKRRSVPIEITHEDLRFIRRPIADYLHVIPLKEAVPHESGNTVEICRSNE